jgi:hypothetical protein
MLHLRMSIVRRLARPEAPFAVEGSASQFLAGHLMPPLSPASTQFAAKHMGSPVTANLPFCNALQSLAGARIDTLDRPTTRKPICRAYEFAGS